MTDSRDEKTVQLPLEERLWALAMRVYHAGGNNHDFAEKAEPLLREAIALTREQQWIAVTKELPKSGEKMTVLTMQRCDLRHGRKATFAGKVRPRVAYWNGHAFATSTTGNNNIGASVVAWQPINKYEVSQ